MGFKGDIYRQIMLYVLWEGFFSSLDICIPLLGRLTVIQNYFKVGPVHKNAHMLCMCGLTKKLREMYSILKSPSTENCALCLFVT